MKPSIRTYLCNDENHRFFGEGPRQLLHAIDETGSLRSAALSMNMAYTKALRIIRSAEATLGFPLTVRTTGGKGGGGSQMTAEARRWQMRALSTACREMWLTGWRRRALSAVRRWYSRPASIRAHSKMMSARRAARRSMRSASWRSMVCGMRLSRHVTHAMRSAST